MNDRYRVSLEKEALIFSAAHFITYGDNICERIHGHNYRVKCDVEGPLNEHGYVIDFIALRDRLKEITQQLDHRVLLPLQHPTINVQRDGEEVVATFEERRWVFPKDDCALLPIDNTTAERLAEWISKELSGWMRELGIQAQRLTVAVDENEGQWGIHENGPDYSGSDD